MLGKNQEGNFRRPVKRTLIKDKYFLNVMNERKKNAWFLFVNLVENILGHHRVNSKNKS